MSRKFNLNSLDVVIAVATSLYVCLLLFFVGRRRGQCGHHDFLR